MRDFNSTGALRSCSYILEAHPVQLLRLLSPRPERLRRLNIQVTPTSGGGCGDGLVADTYRCPFYLFCLAWPVTTSTRRDSSWHFAFYISLCCSKH